MKKCTQCQSLLNENDLFCSRCGFKVSEPTVTQTNHSPMNQQSSFKDSMAFQPKYVNIERKNQQKFFGKKARRVVALALLAVVLVVGGRYLLSSGSAKNSLNLEEFIEVEFAGYDGKGYIVADFPRLDSVGLEEAIREKLSMENSESPIPQFSISDITKQITIDIYKDGKLIDAQNLNNSEELTFRLNYDSQKLQKVLPEINFIGTEKIVSVNVMSLQAIDLFGNYRPKFVGVSPVGKMEKPSHLGGSDNRFIVEATSRNGFPFKFQLNGKELSYEDPVAVGDVITIELNESGIKTLEDMGATPEKNSIEYEVSLEDFEEGAYVTKLSGIQEVINEELSKIVDDSAKAYAAQRNVTGPVKFEGRAFAAVKEGVAWDNGFYNYYPQLIYVYSFEENTFGKVSTSYITISDIGVFEQVENHGKVDVFDNPGDTIQTFNKDSKKYSKSIELSINHLHNYFKTKLDTYVFDMDESLRKLISWTE